MHSIISDTSARVLTRICTKIDRVLGLTGVHNKSDTRNTMVASLRQTTVPTMYHGAFTCTRSNSPSSKWRNGGCCSGSVHDQPLSRTQPFCTNFLSNPTLSPLLSSTCSPPVSPFPALMLLYGREMGHCVWSEGPCLRQTCCCTCRGNIRKPYLPVYCGSASKCFKICIKEVLMSWEEIFGVDQGVLLHLIDYLVMLQHCKSVSAPIMNTGIAVDPLLVNYTV